MKKILSHLLVFAILICNITAVFGEVVNVDYEVYSADISFLEAEKNEIELLIKKCSEEQISYPYEEMRYAVLERFLGYLKDELSNGISYRSEENGYTVEDVKAIYDYNIGCLKNISSLTKTNLNAYLSGEKTPQEVPRILTSDLQIDGKTIMSKTKLNGFEEMRKVFLTGYGHYAQAKDDLDIFTKLGANIIQTEVGISAHALKTSGVKDWLSAYNMNFGTPDYSVEQTADERYHGNYSVRFTNNTAKTPNVWYALNQPVEVEPSTTYTYSFYAKGTNITYFSYKPNSSASLRYVASSTAKSINDWTLYSYTFTTDANQSEAKMYLTTEGTTDAVYVDAVRLEKGSARTETGTNMLLNGSFEEFEGKDEILDSDPSKRRALMKTFEEAAQKNIKVSLLLSPHYFVNELYNDYPDLKLEGTDTYGGIGYHVSHDIAKKAVKFHIETILPEALKYGSISDICMINEPWIVTNTNNYYKKDWAKYLEGVYTTIQNLNSHYGGTSYSSFDDVPFPASGKQPTIQVYDYKQFNDSVMTEWIKFMSECIRKITDIPIHVKSMQYVAWADESSPRWLLGAGLNLERISDYVTINGNDAELRFDLDEGETYSEFITKKALQKSMWYELMLSIKEMPVFNSEDHIIANGDKNYNDAHRKNIGAEQWMSAIHGRSMAALWIWDRSLTRKETYESVMYRPDVVEQIGEVSLDLNRLADEVYAVMNTDAKIGILYSEASRVYQYEHLNSAYKAFEACLFNGVKPGFVVESSPEKLHNYDVVIIPSSKYVKKSVIDELRKYVGNGGKLIIIGNSSLKYDEHTDAHDSAAVSEITSKAQIIPMSSLSYIMTAPTADTLFEAIGSAAEEKQLCSVEIIDNSTGKRVRSVEHMTADINCGKLISICNYDWDNDKNVSIYVNGNKITSGMTELRSGEKLLQNFTLKSYDPILVRVEEE